MREQLTRGEFLARCVTPFRGVDYVYRDGVGWVAWRRGTGDNVELLHVRAFTPGSGHGRALVREMLDRLRRRPPYHSVYGFTRVGNEAAQLFYAALGFRLQRVDGLYQAGEAILFWAPFTELVGKV